MEDTTLMVVFLGLIALTTTVTAVIQVVVLMRGLALMRRVTGVVDRIEHDIRPVLERADSLIEDLQQSAAMAKDCVDRVEKVVASVADRMDHISRLTQDALVEPMRQGSAFVRGLVAAVVSLCCPGNLPKDSPPAEADPPAAGQ